VGGSSDSREMLCSSMRGEKDPVKSMETIGPPYKYDRCRA
jgi:hypothetical protein